MRSFTSLSLANGEHIPPKIEAKHVSNRHCHTLAAFLTKDRRERTQIKSIYETRQLK
jgi:hypothetical protein